MITVLFNLFCPLMVMISDIKMSLFMLLLISLVLIVLVIQLLINTKVSELVSNSIYPTSSVKLLLVSGFLLLAFSNLFSMSCYSFPVTTLLGFNLSLALVLWLTSLLLFTVKVNFSSTVLPKSSPWYLVPFLSLVELISILVRPVTLSFRLLANMSAGHILLSLICNMNTVWVLVSLFGLLELMVSMVQAFVFLMLVNVYFEESLSH